MSQSGERSIRCKVRMQRDKMEFRNDIFRVQGRRIVGQTNLATAWLHAPRHRGEARQSSGTPRLINEMAIHGKYYDLEDMNTKFMKALPEFYDEKISAIEEMNDVDDIPLEAVYGKSRAYELNK